MQNLNNDLMTQNFLSIFQESESFLDLILKQSGRYQDVLIRHSCNGSWQQLSGADFCAHIGRATQGWLDFFPFHEKRNGKTILLLGHNSYTTFICSLGALFAGFDLLCVPTTLSPKDIQWCLENSQGIAIATDTTEVALQLDGFSVPVIDLSNSLWLSQDNHKEPFLLSLYREYKATAKEINFLNETGKDFPFNPRFGHFLFFSFRHDGARKIERVSPDALVVTAHHFLLQLQAPKQIFWKSAELMIPTHPFVHLSRLCVLLKNGIIGFPSVSADWETNLRILQPSLLFAGPNELQKISQFIELVVKRHESPSRFQFNAKIDFLKNLVSSHIALKAPDSLTDMMKKSLRAVSRFAAGNSFLRESVEDLQFIVHGLSQAQESHVRTLEKIGVSVIETFGKTHAAGLLSSTSFHSGRLNTVGTPLPYVNFRLGAQSSLEYRLLHPVFPHCGEWKETGDIVQMTPFGLSVVGQKDQLIVTLGGAVVSPARLEQLLKENDLIFDACVIGDKMPYLSALIVLSHEALADYQTDPEAIKKKVRDAISQMNETLPRHMTLKKFAILDKPFSEENGEKFLSSELNRPGIFENRAEIIKSLYQ